MYSWRAERWFREITTDRLRRTRPVVLHRPASHCDQWRCVHEVPVPNAGIVVGMTPVVRSRAVEPFLRGAAWPAGDDVAYPRADPADFGRLPIDTWRAAQLPVTVRLEMRGDAESVEIGYVTMTDELGYRGLAAGTTFAAYRGDEHVDEQPARMGNGTVRLRLGSQKTDEVITVYLPEGMKPIVTSLNPLSGSIEPAPVRPRWLCYGDSIAEGWNASGPAGAWPAVAARRFGLDVVNLGYDGSARGEIVTAEHMAALSADVISLTHGTNCWSRTPHSYTQMVANTEAFLDVVREGHRNIPVVVASPVIRPDAESAPNKLGATLADLREAMEQVVQARIERGDGRLFFVHGWSVLSANHLTDGIHPGNDGHRILAEVFGKAVASALGSTR